MGRRIIQTVYTCDKCGYTPESGEYLWHMGSEVWCETCTNDNDEIETPDNKQNEGEFVPASPA